jgi:PAS domain S-box-containing protein
MRHLSLVFVARSNDGLRELREVLRLHGYQPVIKWVYNEESLADHLSGHTCDLILADSSYTDFPAKAVFYKTQHLHHSCLFLVLFPQVDEQGIMEAIRMGSDGFLLRSNLGAIVPILESQSVRSRSPLQKFLRNSEPVLEALLERSTDSIWAKHRDGHYLLINPAGARFLGKPIHNILGKVDEELFPPETVQKIRASDRHVMETGETQTIEDVLTAPDGSPRTLQAVKGVFRNEAGEVEGIVGTVRDITLQKEAEQILLEAKERAEQMALCKSEFLATMSHEIRTPLHAILGMADLLAETPLDARQHEFLDTLLASGKSLLSIINDILDYSKIESGKIELKEETISLEQAIRLVVSIFRHPIERKGLRLSYQIAEGVPATIVLDADWFRQILLNLISNAVKYTESGHILLRVSLPNHGSPLGNSAADREISVNDELMLQFAVEDTGRGIPQDKLHSIFESFSQVDPTSSATSSSTGLGLAICRKLVDLMGGRIWLKSRLEEGSTFFFTIRTRIGDPALIAPSGASTLETSREVELFPADERLGALLPVRILVAEDNPTNRYVMKNQLNALGYVPIFAENGLDALKILKEQPFDLVFMDVQMPKLNGFETTRRIRRNLAKEGNRNGDGLRIVAMTAFVAGEDARKCKAAGMDDFLAKPTSKAELRQMILKWFGCRDMTGEHASPEAVASDDTEPRQDGVLELGALRERVPLDPVLLEEFSNMFRKDSVRLRKSLHQAYEKRDCALMKRSAHELKGACMYLGAHRLRNVAALLERLARQQVWDDVPGLLQDVESEADRVESALKNALPVAASC